MSSNDGKRTLPELPNAEHLRKQAKDRLVELRAKTPSARLTHAQLILAREYGFSDWPALQAEVTRRTNSPKGQRARIRRFPVAVARVSPAEEPGDMDFFATGAAVQIGFVLIVLVGLGLVLLALHRAGLWPALWSASGSIPHQPR
jgi:hypothetical protein